MSETRDLFPGFTAQIVPGDGVDIFCRVGGSGPPLLFLHGFPQTHMMWHRVAPELAKHFTCVFADLRGYGSSSQPRDMRPDAFSKRAMAGDMVAVMRHLGHERFALAGHDRGGRCSYRLALDHPAALSRLAVLDITPTFDYWQRLDRRFGLSIYHWLFLAQPAPLPETLIGAAPDFFIEHKMMAWSRDGKDAGFDPVAFESYRRNVREPERLHAMCEDYRAGAGVDVDHDIVDREAGRRIKVPLLVLWGTGGVAPTGDTPVETWREWADDVRGVPIDSGHYLPEENPRQVLDALIPFLRADG